MAHIVIYRINGKGEILKDGHTMFKEDIVQDLNRKSFLEPERIRLEAENKELVQIIDNILYADGDTIAKQHENMEIMAEQALRKFKNAKIREKKF